MKKKKVLMVHNYYQIGGGEHTVFRNEVNLLHENGHEVITYTRSNNELNESKLKMVLLPITTIWSWKTYLEIRKIIKNEKIDIVHCHNTFPLISPSVYYAAKSLNVPVIQTIHNFRFLCPEGSFFYNGKICEKCCEKGTFFYAIKYGCYRNSKIQTLVVVAMLRFHRIIGTYKKISYIFLTNFNRLKFSKLIDINSKKIFIKPNFVKKPETTLQKVERKKFIYAGRIEKNKGINSLLHMWNGLPNDYILHIYGEGKLKTNLMNEYAEKSNIIFHDFTMQDVLFREYASSVAAIIPSELYETFGMAIPECFSMGVPVVCTELGNPMEMILESKGGETYTVNDFYKFKVALDRIINNRDYYSKNALKYYEMYLSDKCNYKTLNNIYNAL